MLSEPVFEVVMEVLSLISDEREFQKADPQILGCL